MSSTTVPAAESTDENDAAYYHVTKHSFQDPLPMHGVPTFLNSLFKVQIRQVSANPLGSHVLLISSEAMLFSYGQNQRGQLGLGFASTTYITTPTVVTALLERGGKAICCAAGADHSLVVVQTEGRRIQRGSTLSLSPTNGRPPLDNNNNTTSSNEAMDLQQLYGFGGNDHMKLGLVNPPMDVSEKVLLPRRTALHARVVPNSNQGILQVAAGVFHSAALVRKSSGTVELYTWGCATQGALGIPTLLREDRSMSPKIVGCPVPVESLTYTPSVSTTAAAMEEEDHDDTSLLFAGEYPI